MDRPFGILLELLPQGIGIGQIENELSLAVQFGKRIGQRDRGMGEAVSVGKKPELCNCTVFGILVPDGDALQLTCR
ncbi:hypothetical protein D3C87_1576270 [compost metagenome]